MVLVCMVNPAEARILVARQLWEMMEKVNAQRRSSNFFFLGSFDYQAATRIGLLHKPRSDKGSDKSSAWWRLELKLLVRENSAAANWKRPAAGMNGQARPCCRASSFSTAPAGLHAV